VQEDQPGRVQVLLRPLAVDGLEGAGVTSVAAGKSHSAAVADSGEAWTWGEGREGKLGHGCTDNLYVPARSGRPGLASLTAPS
jgi:alpha-tubulin suppressor-like RCC1 family protein